MIKIKRIYEDPSPKDGRRVLVDRLWPRGIKKEAAAIDEWAKEVSPSNELRKKFAHDPAKWNEFKRQYWKELRDKTDLLERLRADGKGKTLTLLYAARNTDYNNAIALKELLEQKT